MTQTPQLDSKPIAGHANNALVKRGAEREPWGYASKIANASQSLGLRLRELRRRVEPLKDATEMSQLIRQHPLAAAALALAGGIAIGLQRRGRSIVPSGLGALVGGLALQVVRTGATSWLSRQLSTTPENQ